jgi:SAM-dependent methyltransferase
MKSRDLSQYRCPTCGAPDLSVVVTKEVDSQIAEGELRCINCASSFSIHNCIPRFVDARNYADSFGFQWNVHAKTQLDSQTGLSISHDRVFESTGWAQSLPNQRILEAGSGAGRFTECLVRTGAEIFSFDYSAAVDANWRNNGDSPNLHLFQGDLRKMPLAKGSFDKVLCLGVIQHTPDPHASFLSLAEMVRPDGELVIDIYRRDLLALLQWKYILRPLTTRMPQQDLYEVISKVAPPMIPAAKLLRKIGGRAGARLVPIVEYSHLGLTDEQNKHWSILDTFDAYAPAHDHPQTRQMIESWFQEIQFVDVKVARGTNGLVGKGKRASSKPVDQHGVGVSKACAA